MVTLPKVALAPAGCETIAQFPEPTLGTFASKLAVFTQIVWAVPAFEMVGSAILLITTVAEVGVQIPLAIVQRKV